MQEEVAVLLMLQRQELVRMEVETELALLLQMQRQVRPILVEAVEVQKEAVLE